MSNELEPVDPFDPERCQATTPTGQCGQRAVKGAIYCRRHAGEYLVKQQSKSLYKLERTQFSERYLELLKDPRLGGLENELAILRVEFESAVQNVADPNRERKILALAPLIEKLASTHHKISKETGQLIPKAELLRVAGAMLERFIAEIEELPDFHDRVDRLCADIGEMFEGAGKQ